MSLDADIEASEDLLGKSIDDLQENIVIEDNTLTGTLKYVTDYTGFSSDVELQEGNFLAIHVGGVPEDVTVKVELIGGDFGEKTLDSDRIVIVKVADITQKIKVEAIKDSNVITKTYSLAGLTLASEESDQTLDNLGGGD